MLRQEQLMSKFSIAALPEVFVSDGTISGAVYEAARRGQLRKLGTRLYTRNLDEVIALLVNVLKSLTISLRLLLLAVQITCM